MPPLSIGSSARRRGSAPAFSSATGARDCTTSPESHLPAGLRVPTASPAPTVRRADDELVALEHADRARVGMHEVGRLLHDLVENRGRVELGREEPAGARQLLRERARALLAFEQLASLERAARRVGEMMSELEVVVRERPLVREQDDDEPPAARRAVSTGMKSAAWYPAAVAAARHSSGNRSSSASAGAASILDCAAARATVPPSEIPSMSCATRRSSTPCAPASSARLPAA